MIVAEDGGDLFLAKLVLLTQPPGSDTTTVAPASLTSRVTSAPSDSSLSNSQFQFWLDDTPGATKLMIKAKDSAGTVRTGSVNLT